MSLDKRVRFVKIGDKWGVNGPREVCVPGAVIEVSKRDGSTSHVKIVSATPARTGYVDCAIESQDRRDGAGKRDSAGNSIRTGASYRAGVTAAGGRKCDYCGSRECSRAWNPRDLCDED